MGLKIGLVGRCVNTPHIRGMGKYVYELLAQSAASVDVSWMVYGDDVRHPMTLPARAGVTPDVFSFRGDRFHGWEQLGLPRRAAAQAVDLLHCTEGTLPLWQPRPTVVTVHDTLMWDEHDGSLVSKIYFDWLLPAHAYPPPESVMRKPPAGLAMTFDHGVGGGRSGRMTNSRPSAENPP